MKKKDYCDNLRELLENKLKTYHPNIIVKITKSYSRLVVVFPPQIVSLHFYEMDLISAAGRAIWISYFKDHFEVVLLPYFFI